MPVRTRLVDGNDLPRRFWSIFTASPIDDMLLSGRTPGKISLKRSPFFKEPGKSIENILISTELNSAGAGNQRK
jgi:hypothetical protein